MKLHAAQLEGSAQRLQLLTLRSICDTGVSRPIAWRGNESIIQALLMNLTAPRSNAMQYRDQETRHDSEMLLELENEFDRDLSAGKQYRQKRSGNPKRRKAPKVSHPGCGMSSRRNHRWTW
jgi:hypothetical protein